MTETLDDILEELAPRLAGLKRPAGEPEAADLSLFERALLDVLGEDPLHVDALAAHAQMTVPDALVHLLSLEFKGAVRQIPGKRFVRL